MWRLLQHTQSKKNSHARQKARARTAGNSDFDTQKSKMRFFVLIWPNVKGHFTSTKITYPSICFSIFGGCFFSVLLLFDKSLMYKFFKSNPLSVEKTVLCSLFSLSDISTSPRQIGFTVFLCLSLLLLLNLSH